MSQQGGRDMTNDASDGAFVAPRAAEGAGIAILDRVEQLLRFHEFDPVHNAPGHGCCAYTPDGYVCDFFGSEESHHAHVAAAIVKALGLTEERHTAPEYETKAVRGGTGVFRYGGQTSRYVGNGTRRRFVTPWEADA